MRLTRDDLAMTLAESNILLESDKSSTPHRLAALAHGWPVVVGLAALLRDAQPPDGVLPTALYDFFAEELMRSANTALQDNLVTLALLPALTPRSLQAAFGDTANSVLEEASNLGAIASLNDHFELHPLLRDFIITRLQTQPDAVRRVRSAVHDAIEESAWDTAIELVQRFELFDLVEDVFCAAYHPLLRTGRVNTWSVSLALHGVPVALIRPALTSSTQRSPCARATSAVPRMSLFASHDNSVTLTD